MIRSLFKKFQHKVIKKISAVSGKSPLINYIKPSHLVPEKKLARLGTPYGGWLIPIDANLNSDSTCYLAGAGEDISFDCALAQKFQCNIKIIDPTPRAIKHFEQLSTAIKEGKNFPINNSTSDFYDIKENAFSKLKFIPYGLADEDAEQKFYLPRNPAHVSCSTVNLQNTDQYFMAQCYQLTTIMNKYGDTKIDLLKMDIEGGEYAVIKNLLTSRLLPRILLIEFDEAHSPFDADANKRIQHHVNQLLNAGMRCVAIEGSNATFVRDEHAKIKT